MMIKKIFVKLKICFVVLRNERFQICDFLLMFFAKYNRYSNLLTKIYIVALDLAWSNIVSVHM